MAVVAGGGSLETPRDCFVTIRTATLWVSQESLVARQKSRQVTERDSMGHDEG